MRLEDTLKAHCLRYPQAQTADLIKLTYQYTLGPNHAITDIENILTQLKNEASNTPAFVEKISNTYSRFHFNKDSNLACLAALFAASCQEKQDLAALQQNLRILETFRHDDMIETYISQGCLPIAHSDIYKEHYQPHYRVIKNNYADFFPLYARLFHDKSLKIIAIDGSCASGKTTLAQHLAQFYTGSAILHIDDFYLPQAKRKATWLQDIAGNIDIAALYQALKNFKGQKKLIYRPFDCHFQHYQAAMTINDPTLLIVEGSYSLHPELAAFYDLKIFLDCQDAIQLSRLASRNEDIERFQNIWIKKEREYFAACAIKDHCDLYFDTTKFF